MFVIFRASALDPFGCPPEESHADLAFNHPMSHALLSTPKHLESLLHQLPVCVSEALSRAWALRRVL